MYQYNFNKSSTGAPFITLDQIESLTESILNKYCPSAIENFEAVDIEGLAEFDLGFNVEYAYLSHNGCYAGMMVFNDDQVIRTMKSLMPNVETGQWELEYLTDRANTILIDKQLDNPRDKGFRRFTLAHECGHGVIHPCVFYRDPNQLSFFNEEEKPASLACRTGDVNRKKTKRWGFMDTIEWQANTFASCLLMNKKAIRKYLYYLGYDKHIKDETYLFDFIMKVSEQFQVSKTAALVRLKVLGYAPNDFELTKELYNEFSF